MGRRLAILVFLCLTLLMGLFFPMVLDHTMNREETLPPGISAPEQQLLRIWLVGDPVSASSWLKRQAARLENAKKGVSVYLRVARPEEITRPDAVLPDLILFGPGAIKAPESLLLPLTGEFPMADGALRAGKWQGMQYAVPVCMDGYVLAYDPALTGIAAATPAPTPLLGIGAAPSKAPEPKKEATFVDLLSALLSVPREKSVNSDFHCAAGMPLMIFSSFSGGRAGLKSAALSQSFGTASSDAVFSEFSSGRCRAAMLKSTQLRTLAGQRKAFAIFTPPLPVTDLYLSAGILPGEGQELAMNYLDLLLSIEGQRDLVPSGLMEVAEDMVLYGGDPVFWQVEDSMKGDLILPNAFSTDEQSLNSISHSVFANGGVLSDIFESIR